MSVGLDVFSSNASPLKARRSYRPFQLFQHLEYGGNYHRAVEILALAGWEQAITDVEDSPLEVLSLPALMAQEYLPLTWVDHPILPSGLCILAGRLKSGKSILALNLAVAVAYGGNAFQRDNLTTNHGSP